MDNGISFSISDYAIRRAGYDDAGKIAALMQDVHSKLDDKELFICDDKSFVIRHIETEGFVLIAENRTFSAICGVFIVRYPQKSDDNLGRYLNLCENDLPRVAHMESSVVKESERGHHLEEEMMRACESYIDGKYDIFLGVTSPKNIASIKAFTKNGYAAVKENIDYNGFKRNIYIKYRDKQHL